MSPEPFLTPWQAWMVALAGGLVTLAIRVLPVVAFRNLGGGRLRDILDCTGFGIMGAIVAQTALKSGRALFAGSGAGMVHLGMLWAILAVALAFVLSVRFGWKILATLAGLSFFLIGGLVFGG